MKKTLLTSILTALALMMPVMSFADYYEAPTGCREAFPGAEGYGRYTKGGRGGKVYHVTTLEDNNQPGSFRYAVNQKGPRTIVFDVDGTIHLKSELNLKEGFVTIAGQTAPGDGICIADYPFSIRANNVIIRFMRFRPGNKNVLVNGADGWDGLGALDQRYIIVDHCSVSWSIDECLSFSGCSYTTVQWCLVSQSLVHSGHSKGNHGYGGNWGGEYASYHHNMMAHHTSRVPRLGPRPTTQLNEQMDMRNNIFYNYSGESCYGGEGMNVNIVENYYKPGPGNGYSSGSNSYKYSRIAAIGIRTESYCHDSNGNPNDYYPALHKVGTYYVNGNYNSARSNVYTDNWTNGMYNQIDWDKWDDLANTEAKKNQLKADMKLAKPIYFEYTTTHNSQRLNQVIPNYVGASLHRDALDAAIIKDFSNNSATCGTGDKYNDDGTKTNDKWGKGFVNTTDDVKAALGFDYPELKAGTVKTDTDGDGIPDEWETANKLNPNDDTDGAKDSGNGYTNLEVYMNSLVQDIVDNGNKAGGGVLLHGDMVYSTTAKGVELPAYDPNAEYVFDMGSTPNPGPGEEENPDDEEKNYWNMTELPTNAQTISSVTGITFTLGGQLSANGSVETSDADVWKELKKQGFTVGNAKFTHFANAADNPRDINGESKLVPVYNGFGKYVASKSGKITIYFYVPDSKSVRFLEVADDATDVAGTNLLLGANPRANIYKGEGDDQTRVDLNETGIPQNVTKGVGILTCDLKAGHTYYLALSGSKLGIGGFMFEADDKSGLDNIISDDPREKDTRVFNLMGVEMRDTENLAPGIYIRGGKKFMVR